MKSKIILGLLTTLMLVALPISSGCATPAPEVTELSYSNFFPPTHFHSILAEEWIKEIEARTDGQVKITYYPGSTLLAKDQVFDGVVDGIADIGMSCLIYTAGRFPASELVDLPHAYPNGWVATKVANDFYNNFQPAEFADAHMLYFHGHGPGVIFTAKKPVSKMEELDGLLIRATGAGVKIMEALGATGYGAGQPDAYELLSKGVVDGTYAPREVLKGWKQAEVVNYVTNCTDVGNTTDMYVVINQDKWDALPENIKTIFTDVSEEWIEKHGMVWDYYDQAAIDYFLSFEGRELIELPADEMARWVDATKVVIDDYLQELTGKGLPASEYQKYLLERVSYWSGQSPAVEESVAWVKANLEPLAPA